MGFLFLLIFFCFSPIYAAAYCVRDKISSYTGGEKYCESEDIVAMLFDDNTKRQEFYSSLQSSPSNSTDEERRFLDALARYSVDKCPSKWT